MNVLITGSAGRVGRAIYIHLMKKFSVKGLDRLPCSTADFVGDLRDEVFLDSSLNGVDVIIHSAALHAPHVGEVPDSEFVDINVKALTSLLHIARQRSVKHVIYTSTTALYGYASTPEGRAGWIDETVVPEPRTIYHRTKIDAENILESWSQNNHVPVTVLQMSRCFPESADRMAFYRLNRGIDARDVASAHLCAVEKRLSGFNRFIISFSTPFKKYQCRELVTCGDMLIKKHCPELVDEFVKRGWAVPSKIDRVYDSSSAREKLSWNPKYGFKAVLEMLDNESSEVLPVISDPLQK